jgi:CxxC motif-containing protein (DUF1111 family)
MKLRSFMPILLSTAVLGPALGGCIGDGDESDTAADAPQLGEITSELAAGGHLPGITDAAFAAAKALFAAVETPADGIGPIFNARGCAVCHSNTAPGGAGEQIERRFGRFVNGAFDPMAALGGSLRQLQTLGSFNPAPAKVCAVPLEQEPAGATVKNVGRRTTALFGLGLVDAMPDAFFDRLAAAQPAAIRGVANRVPVVFPDPRDPTQAVGSVRVGRFGWKAGVPNLLQFSADAYVNEMGITTQSCVRGRSITAFATENLPNNRAPAAGCPDDLIPGTDEPVGSCAGGLTKLQDDVEGFHDFMTFLSPPARGAVTPAVTAGSAVFDRLGCAGCHVRTAFVTPAKPFNGVPGNYTFRPFSDFLVHDMGTLGDQIGDAGDSLPVTRRMRTAPLWGLRLANKKLHDGRTVTVAGAILAHDGQGAAARAAYQAASAADRANLAAFLLSL